MEIIEAFANDNFIKFNVTIAKETSNDAAILFSYICNRMLYFKKLKKYYKEIFLTHENIGEYCNLTPNKIRSAIKILTDKGYIKVEKKGIPAKNYYTLLVTNFLTDYKNEEPDVKKTDDQSCENQTTSDEENEQHNRLENSSNNRLENRTKIENDFDVIRKTYMKYGKSRGLKTEFEVLKKHKDYKDVISFIFANFELFEKDLKRRGAFIQHFKTYLYNREWEIIESDLQEQERKRLEREEYKRKHDEDVLKDYRTDEEIERAMQEKKKKSVFLNEIGAV